MLPPSPPFSPAESEFPLTPNDEHLDPGSLASSSSSFQPRASKNGLIEVIHDDKIDWEEEEQFYSQFNLDNEPCNFARRRSFTPPARLQRPPSLFSNDIWLGDNTSEISTVALGVSIIGWTSVGDKLGGAYIVYDCAIRTCQNTTIHVLKRYSSFVDLHRRLLDVLPESVQSQIPKLPPKYPWAKYRPTFLDKRRRMLQQWLTAVLLHPEVGGSGPVKDWIMS